MGRDAIDDTKPLPRKAKPSRVEEAKAASRLLRGTLAEALNDDATGVSEADSQILKFHGAYQQEDRDHRSATRRSGAPRRHTFMMRVKIPGGVLTPDQYLALDRLAENVVYNRSMRLTTRQNVQLHGVLKGDLKEAIRRIDEVLLTTLSGCGDVERNIVAPPAPFAAKPYRELRALTRALTEAMTPMTNAYREIWLDGELVTSSAESEPLYGDRYLPRKFKTGLALPDDDSVSVRDQDVGLVALVEDGSIRRFNVLLGGGGGLTHRKASTYARLATPMGSIAAEHAVPLTQAVLRVFRDHGDLSDRRHARFKYLVEEWGIDRVRTVVSRAVDFPIEPWQETPPLQTRHWLGAHPQGDGRVFYGLPIASGRVVDGTFTRTKSALRVLVEMLQPEVIITPQQSLIFGNLRPADVDVIEEVLRSFRVPLPSSLSPLRRSSLSCPALPTCGLALAEAERVAPEILGEVERALAAVGGEAAELDVRITGCPNGCARPYNAELGFVGRKPDHYDVFIGGTGERLAVLYAEQVKTRDVAPTLQPLLDLWMERRRPGERLGDFFIRSFDRRERKDLLTGEKLEPAHLRVEESAGREKNTRRQVA